MSNDSSRQSGSPPPQANPSAKVRRLSTR